MKKIIEQDIKLNEDFYHEILQQLGGNKFIAMTGAKNLAYDKQKRYFSFRLPRAKDGINYVKITHTAMDLYDVEYGRISGTDYKVITTSNGLYNDMLVSNFERTTGLYTRL